MTGIERQKSRLRGAGRVCTTSEPVNFTFKDLRPIPLNDVTSSTVNKQQNSPAKQAKFMDFATPKIVKAMADHVALKASVPIAQSKIVDQSANAMASTPTLEEEVELLRFDDHSPICRALQDSPELVATPIIAKSRHSQLKIDQLEIYSQPVTEVMETQLELHNMLEVQSDPLPLKSGKGPRRKLTKLERELGLGSSRFIVGAKNYISPDRDHEPHRRRSARLSEELTKHDRLKAVFKTIATPRKTRTIKITKRTITVPPRNRKYNDREVQGTPSPTRPKRGRPRKIKLKEAVNATAQDSLRPGQKSAAGSETTFHQLELRSDPIQYSSALSE